MKKWKTLLAATALTLGLAACNQTAQPTDSGVADKSDMTLKEVYAKSIEVSEQLKSVKVQMTLDQKMNMPGEEEINMVADMDMDVVIDPIQIYQKGTTSMIMGEGMEEDMDIEAYLSTESFYMFESTTGQWMKLPQDMMDELMGSTDQSNPAEQLQMLEEYLEDFTFEQDDKNYILKMNASGEKFTALIQAQVDEALKGLGDSEGIDMDYTINSLNYVLHIDKETFQTNKVDMVMDMVMTMDGETVTMIQDLKTTYSNFNELTEITVPQEIVESAVEIEI